MLSVIMSNFIVFVDNIFIFINYLLFYLVLTTKTVSLPLYIGLYRMR